MTIIAMIGLLFALLGWTAELCQDVEKKIAEHLKTEVPLKVIATEEAGDSCEVVVQTPQGSFVPVYVYSDYVILGTKFSKGESITVAKLNKMRKAHLKKLYSELSTFMYVSYKPKKAKKGKVLYFISDPDCPYCERVKGKVKELADKYGWEVRVVWLPLPMHPDAERKAVSFLCEGRSYEDYLKGEYGNKKCEEGERSVKRAKEELLPYVGGTPFFIFPGGESVNGANVPLLEKLMSH